MYIYIVCSFLVAWAVPGAGGELAASWKKPGADPWRIPRRIGVCPECHPEMLGRSGRAPPHTFDYVIICICKYVYLYRLQLPRCLSRAFCRWQARRQLEKARRIGPAHTQKYRRIGSAHTPHLNSFPERVLTYIYIILHIYIYIYI